MMDPKTGRVLVDVGLFAIYAIASTVGLVVVKSTLPTLQLMPLPGSLLTPAFLQFTCGFVLYVMSFGVWIVNLARLPLTLAYPIAIGLTMAGSAMAAVVVLDEAFGALKLFGFILIFSGTVMLSVADR
jgi:multidrug transporter EmrE-like cation transporter